MEDSFSITSETQIYLYGAASIGKIVFNNLKRIGIEARGFIDKRAGEMKEFLGIKVFALEDCSAINRDAVIIISVKNVFEHYSIAAYFIKMGFHKLVYMPKEVLDSIGDEKRKVVGDTYLALVDGTKSTFEQIPVTKQQQIYAFEEYPVKLCNEQDVIAEIPVSYIFTNDYDPAEQKWGNVNILAFFTHMGFFEHLLGVQDTNIDDYLEEYCIYTAKKQGDIVITDAWKKNVIRNRSMIFREMNRAYELDPDFFFQNPPTAIWNPEKRYFNLTSGKHRVMFLAAKGRHYIPLRISKRDYKCFVNREAADELVRKLSEDGYIADMTVDNPLFYKYPVNDFDNDYLIKKTLSLYLARILYEKEGRVDFGKCSLTVVGNMYFGVARHFARMGAGVEFIGSNDNYRSGIMDVEGIEFKPVENPSLCVLISNAYPDVEYEVVCTSLDGLKGYRFENKVELVLEDAPVKINIYRRQ